MWIHFPVGPGGRQPQDSCDRVTALTNTELVIPGLFIRLVF